MSDSKTPYRAPKLLGWSPTTRYAPGDLVDASNLTADDTAMANAVFIGPTRYERDSSAGSPITTPSAALGQNIQQREKALLKKWRDEERSWER